MSMDQRYSSCMTSGERPDALSAWRELCVFADTGRARISHALQERVGLTLSENLVLCQIAMAHGGELQMAAISDQLHLGKSAITKTVDRLEARDLVARRRDATDRRIVYAMVSSAGADLFRRAQPAFVEEVLSLMSPLTAAEVRQLRRMLEKLSAPSTVGLTA